MTSPPAAPPVAFRLRRPYDSEDEFVQGDGASIEKAGMVLIGAGSRPSGLVVRFELALRDGTTLFRGEGRVVGFRTAEEAQRPAGLEVRFTRLDSRGKALIERVLRGREASVPDLLGTPSIPPLSLPSMPAPSGPLSSPPPLVIPAAAPLPSIPLPEPSAPVDPPSASDEPLTSAAHLDERTTTPAEVEATAPLVLPTAAETERVSPTDEGATIDIEVPMAAAPALAVGADEVGQGRLATLRARGATAVEAPAEREALLARLRSRGP